MTEITVGFVFQVIVTASATVAAAAAVGIYRRVDTLVGNVEKHERTLYGEAENPQWDGLVERVADHEAELEEERPDEAGGGE